jgi:glycosyltransferase involved in cell wall biosynthesis
MTDQLAIVMPVYNEEEIISTVIESWHKEIENLEIDFKIHAYNDGSKDDSLSVLRSLEPKFPNLIVHDKENSGHGPTILKAYKDNSDCEWIFQTDSDNEMEAKYFSKLWNNKEKYDFLIGLRKERKQTIVRKIITVGSRMVVGFYYGFGVKDVNSPYRLMRTSVFKDYYNKIMPNTFAPNLVISGIVNKYKIPYYETQVPFRDRETGEVTGVSTDFKKLLKMIVKATKQTIKNLRKIISK